MILIVGANSNLAKSIANVSSEEVLTMSRNEYKDWHYESASGAIREFLCKSENRFSRIYLTAGITDPSHSARRIQEVNLDLPLRVIRVASELGIRTITFGTVAETFGGLPNNYVASKVALSNEMLRNGYFDNLAKHFRLHTLFGGTTIKSHMFLGQMVESILSNKEFYMSAGNQIREYHHVDDVAEIINNTDLDEGIGNFHISHGKPHRLIDVALSVFSKYGDLNKLKVGKLEIDQSENFESRFTPWPSSAEHSVRSSLEEIGKYVEMQIEMGRKVT